MTNDLNFKIYWILYENTYKDCIMLDNILIVNNIYNSYNIYIYNSK